LFEHGAKDDVRTANKDGWTPLNSASNSGHLSLVKFLYEHGAKEDVRVPSENGWTPLHAASASGHIDVLNFLYRDGAQPLDTSKVDVDAKDNYGRTPLSCAAQNGHQAVVKQLLDSGKVDVDSKDNYGRTPLSHTAQGGHQKVATLLPGQISTHGLVDAAGTESSDGVVEPSSVQNISDCTPDLFGRTPFMWAALGGHMSLIHSLWSSCLPTSHSYPSKTDNLGLSLIHFFAIGNCVDGVNLILDVGFNVDETDSQGWTPLHWAAYFGHQNVADVLLHRNADTSCVDLQGWTPYELAIFVGDSAMARSLESSFQKDPCGTGFRDAEPLRGYCDVCGRVSPALIPLDITHF
jgi:ankyrin repeat protein